jgi:hypothetical protein
MSKATAKIKEEFYAVLPPTLFFFFALHIVAIIRVLMNKDTGIPLSTTTSVAIAALVLGKSVLLADMMPLINRYPQKPLIYNIAWKTLVYMLVASVIHYLERLWDFAKEAGGVAAGNDALLTHIVWPHFWATQILLFLLILMYCTMHEFTRVIGRDKVRKIFFGPV